MNAKITRQLAALRQAAQVKRTDDELPRIPLRRRVLVGLLAVVTAVTIVLLLIYRPGDPKREVRVTKPNVAASGVGRKADVMLLPPPASSPQR